MVTAANAHHAEQIEYMDKYDAAFATAETELKALPPPLPLPLSPASPSPAPPARTHVRRIGPLGATPADSQLARLG